MASNNHSSVCETIECPICMLEIEGVTNRVTTECGHQFHTKCLLSNVAFNGFGCPYCRSEMVEESVSKNAHEDDDDDDDDDDEDTYEETDFEGDEEQDEEQDEEDILRGFRYFMQRVTGEVLTDRDDNDQEDLYEEELAESQQPKPSINLIIKKLTEKGFTMEKFVKAILIDHPEFNQDEVDNNNINDDIYNEMRNIIENYTPEQEQELEENSVDQTIQEMVEQLLTPPSPKMEEELDFYFLNKNFIENHKNDFRTSYWAEMKMNLFIP
jgi:hypothetical protein